MFSNRSLGLSVLWAACLVTFVITACAPVVTPPTPTVTATPSPFPTLTATATKTPTPRTPPTLPITYQNETLTPFGTPRTYLEEPCPFLQTKWSSQKSAPGTVVMAIMFHSITRTTVTSADQISEFNLRRLMNNLHDNGFQAITTSQMLGFMENNARIPERSVLLIVDDRRTSAYYEAWFREYWEKWGWPVVNAWISTDLSTASLWQQQISLENEGFVDHQGHGFIHNIPIGPDSTDGYILGELQKPIDIFKENFNKIPTAIIWPGGGFTPHAAAIARQLGYRLGFTTNPRGPIMFNWVPLADAVDPKRPTWIPEGQVKDPLMVLPRYWDTDAILHIPEVIQIGEEAAAFAAQNKATELEYYDIVCATRYGPIP